MSLMSLMIPDFSALIQNHVLARRSANIAQYGTKADVYFQLKQYLAHPLSGRSAYERIAGITPPQHSLSKKDIERLDFDIKHVFSDDVYTRFTEVMALAEEMRNIDFDLYELFDTIKLDMPEQYQAVQAAILDDNCTKESEEVLNQLEITFVQQAPGRDRQVYNFRDLEREYKEIYDQFAAAASAILSEIENEIEHC